MKNSFVHALMAMFTCLLLSACSHPALRQSEEFSRNNQLDQAHKVLAQAVQSEPQNVQLRAAQQRVQERLLTRLFTQLDGYRMVGRWDEARSTLQLAREAAPTHPRLAWYDAELERGQRHDGRLQEARRLFKDGQLDRAEVISRDILQDAPQHPGARQLLSQIHQARPIEWHSPALGPAFQKPVSLEFREAPLRMVFESLAQSSQLNFIFDKDVQQNQSVSVYLRQVSLDEAMRSIMSVYQLERRILSENTVLIYPATQSKQREMQELITRTLYLTHMDAKQAMNMLRSVAKVRDGHVDERLNALIIRETPEVVRLAERLLASIDVSEAEVMLEVEVMELSSDRLAELGLKWPEQVQYGLLGGAATVELGQRNSFRASITNPAAVATLKGTAGSVNLLANPKIRVRSREKAKIHIGQRLPVFTTTSTANVGVSASVNYLDVGLKLDVEPIVQLDNDVVMRVALEVSNVIRQVQGPAGTSAYEIGTRQSQTTLKLNDGETQVLAGLINDEERRNAVGVPGLSSIPLLGTLFGVQSDGRNKSEVVLLITPRVVRSVGVPEVGLTVLPGGTETDAGAPSVRINSQRPALADPGLKAPPSRGGSNGS